jgi:hypothetical protein
MFFEDLIFVWILIKFDQNPGNNVKEITRTATVGDVQNSTYKLHTS